MVDRAYMVGSGISEAPSGGGGPAAGATTMAAPAGIHFPALYPRTGGASFAGCRLHRAGGLRGGSFAP